MAGERKAGGCIGINSFPSGIPLKQKLYHTTRRCLRNQGFCADPNLSIQKNFNNTLEKGIQLTLPHPTNLTFHNLCKTINLPNGTRQLLGLNLKYCLAASKPPNNLKKTVQKMAYSIRTKFQIDTIGQPTENNYIKQLYIQNKNWNPSPAPPIIKDKITVFDKMLKEAHQKLTSKNKNKNLQNLTYDQSITLRLLKNNHLITIKPTDKNLGPTILETNSYIMQVLTEHLLTADYLQLPEPPAKHKMEEIKAKVKLIIANNHHLLSKAELTFFQRSFQNYHRIPIFYGLPKVHKNPMTLRPVVSTSGSFLSILSTWIDFKMKDLLPLVKSYIPNSFTLINELKHLQIPEGALLFTADAKSMYTNIDTATGVSAIRDFILNNLTELPKIFPTELFLLILTIIMENNIFTFANTFWLQLSGTAMGTPAACSYATISYGQHENCNILPKFQSQLLYYKRYIDNIFGIWLPPSSNQLATRNAFKSELNNWGKLEWVIEEPSLKTVFLDLNITIHNSNIKTSTYQKEMNIYLYIPLLSSHPPSCFKGLIHGELQRYFTQNNKDDFIDITTKFIKRLLERVKRLLERGHTIETPTPLLLQAAAKLDSHIPKESNNSEDSTLFIHWIHHPNGLQRCDIRRIYNATLKDVLPYSKMQLAIYRPKNLRNILTRAATKPPNDTNVNQIIEEISKP